jgi:membrane-bound metal-dependent hydrolase YbcI (DUF457 family)
MPNVLAHFGGQGPVSSAMFREVAPQWVLLGCVIPDIPWIMYRALRTLVPGLNPYDLRAYAVAQSSLFLSLFLCAAIAAIALQWRKVFAVLALGAVLHLVLDALQTKWANGVHFFAPLSWKLVNFGFFWPESAVTLALAVGGIVYFAWAWRRRRQAALALAPLEPRRLFVFSVLTVAYLALPLALREAVVESDSHFLKTLRDTSARAGRYVEFDRVGVLRRDETLYVQTFAGEEISLRAGELTRARVASVRGRFLDATTLAVLEVHPHGPGLRDLASYAGLTLLVGIWAAIALSGTGNRRRHSSSYGRLG